MKAEAVPEATRAMLAKLWDKNLPVMQDRVNELAAAADTALRERLAPESRQSAEATAHKLAGSLGMFGYRRGTELSREIEQMLDSDEPLDPQRFAKLLHELKVELKF